MDVRKCEYRECNNPLVQRKGEDNEKFRLHKYCCSAHGNAERKAKGADLRAEQMKKVAYEDSPVSKRFALSKELEDSLARSEIRLWVKVVNDVPSDQKYRMAGEVKTFRPGDPEFDAIAKTVTPIGEIPDRHEESILYYHLG